MSATCTHCPEPAVEGDPLHLCRTHGGLSWSDFDESAWLGLNAA